MGGRQSAKTVKQCSRDNNNDLLSVCIAFYLLNNRNFLCEIIYKLYLIYLLYLFVCVQFAQLINTYRKLGAEKFPLIEQTFYPNYKEMVRTPHHPLSTEV